MGGVLTSSLKTFFLGLTIRDLGLKLGWALGLQIGRILGLKMDWVPPLKHVLSSRH